MKRAIFPIFQDRARRSPDAPFLHLEDGTTLSYRAAFDRTGQIANLFLARGVKPGDRIAIQAEKGVDTLLTYLASLRIGAVYLPLNTAYTAAEIRFFLGDARPALFLHRAEDEAEMAALCAELGVPERLTLGADGRGTLADGADAQPAPADAHDAHPDDLAAILYTSGTTGRSKGAMLTHGNLASNAATLADYWRFTASDVLLHALPIFHTHGLFVATNTTIVAGSAIRLLPRFDAGKVLQALPGVTVMMGVPTFYTRLLSEPAFTHALVAHVRLFVSGSAPLSAETHKAFQVRTGHAILERYGMTETNMNTSNPYDGDRVPGSVGFPLPGIELQITDPETGAELPQGSVGMIEVRGPNVFKGYWELPEKTREELRQSGFFITGDLGMVDARGYVSIVGRARDLIICGGYNVYPAEVETLLDAIPGVAESAVIGLPHPDMGEGVVAVVQAKDPALSEGRIVAALAGQLARFKQPRRILFLPELPRNTMGKIQKKELRERFARLFLEEHA
ncbi:malonyl-CoA/methylmalonyl-CoA synthetase [Sphingomonas kyeonggiensis]|uniref:malonate--CoA ligase n=1 Tax=Sphingomonas kyeonggiensis TaxID=1268553 RepID=UPI00278430B8|nr:malonyl-CoA synthase [Sphingomonas kyeonggiensis]MDQ0249747.1 malonyl-CoA/methylmalonyl-CoA synthetase [Sphingomonas kyeonggiensis]